MPPQVAVIQLPRRAPQRPEVRFLRERFAMAIERGDDATAKRMMILLDQALNGTPASIDGA